MRETLFNWLQGDIRGARCLDLFAGSGAFTFEAVSRGAAQVVAVEMDRSASSQIRCELAALRASNVEVVSSDVSVYIDQAANG